MTHPMTTFYQEMPPMRGLRQITDPLHYQDVPDDWYIALTDVIDSTIAIESGRYKAVNTVAAVTITAVLNSLPAIDVPYLFGGDGAALVVPPQVVDQVRDALAAIKWLAAQNFDLQVRAGLIPVRDVTEAGHALRVGKLAVNENHMQPVFTGGGLDHADHLLKTSDTRHLYEIAADQNAPLDLSGYECRWSKHPAASGEVVSLLVRATRMETYDHIIDTIQQIYGDQQTRHPIDFKRMRVAANPAQYQHELGWKQQRVTWLNRLSLMVLSILGYLLFKYVARSWGRYQQMIYQTTDHEKFDDTLRMTISGTTRQRAQLVAYLDELHRYGQVAYGIHTARHALMTCIVFDRFGRQIHFVDADEGGYAMAARGMKQQLKVLAERPRVAAS